MRRASSIERSNAQPLRQTESVCGDRESRLAFGGNCILKNAIIALIDSAEKNWVRSANCAIELRQDDVEDTSGRRRLVVTHLTVQVQQFFPRSHRDVLRRPTSADAKVIEPRGKPFGFTSHSTPRTR